MKVDVLFENEDRLAMMKAMQGKKYASMRDSLSRRDVSLLARIVKQKARKQNPRAGIPEETIETLAALKLVDPQGNPTGEARSFLKWVIDNPSREQDFADKRGDADDALTRGQLKRDNDWVNPMQKRARKIIRNLSDDEKESFRKLYNRFINKRTRNLAGSWPDARPEDVAAMKDKGILDVDGNLTDFGEFTLNYYTAFKNDPDGLDRVSRDKRVGNFGDTRRRRSGRMRRAINR